MLSVKTFVEGVMAIAVDNGITPSDKWQEVVYNNLKSDFTDADFITACKRIMTEVKLYDKMPTTRQFLDFAPAKLTAKELTLQSKVNFLNKVSNYLQEDYISSYDREAFSKDLTEIECRTLQSAGGISELWRRVHDLDYPTSIAKIRKELADFYEDNCTVENINRKIAISSERGGQQTLGNTMTKLLNRFQ